MKNSSQKSGTNDIEKIKDFLVKLGFICNSFPSAENLIYVKGKERIIVTNDVKGK